MHKFGICIPAICLIAAGLVPGLTAQEALVPRKLAPGVLRVVKPDLQADEAVSTMEPLYDLATVPFQPETVALSDTLAVKASGVVLRRDVWGLEFSYKPLRMIEADVPQPSGKLQRKNIWYLMYRVRFLGDVIGSQERGDVAGNVTYEVVKKDVADSSINQIRLFPAFALKASVIEPGTGQVQTKEYLDRVMPAVIDQIREAEDPAIPLLSSVGISTNPIYQAGNDQFAVGGEVWGVATWENIDPRTDYVTVQIRGLTNAYRVQQTDEGKQFKHKTLQLNFYRPGDEIDDAQDRIHPGIPLVDESQEQVEILDAYQLPGPQLVTFEVDSNVNRTKEVSRLVTTQDAKFNTLEALELNGGSLPAILSEDLTAAGYDVSGAEIGTESDGYRWEIAASRGGQSVLLRVDLEPLLWRKFGEEFQFTDRLESFWLYR